MATLEISRTLEEHFSLKFCTNISTSSLSKNLDVLIKKKTFMQKDSRKNHSLPRTEYCGTLDCQFYSDPVSKNTSISHENSCKITNSFPK